MRQEQIQRLIERFLTTEPHELDCATVTEIIARYVDAEVLGQDARTMAPGLPKHFLECPHCAEMYLALFQLAEMEAGACMPDLAELWREIEAATRPGPWVPPESLVQRSPGRAPRRPRPER